MSRPGRYLVPLVFALAAAYTLIQVHHILLPFVLAATLAYLLNPLVNFFEVHGIRRQPAAVVVFFALILFLGTVVYVGLNVAYDELSHMSSDLPVLWERTVTLIRKSWLHHLPWVAHLEGNTPAAIAKLWDKTPSIAVQLIPLFELVFLVPFLAFLGMMDGPGLRDALLAYVPARYVEMVLNILVEIDNSLGNYVRGLCLESLFMGLMAGAGFAVIGLHYALPIAFLVAATSVIPLVGPLAAAIVGGLVAFLQWGTLAGLAKVLVLCLVIRLIDDWFLQPLILRRAVHLHPALIVFSLMAGGSLFGFWGLLFAVPAVCMIKVFFEVVWEWYRTEYGLHYDSTPAEVSHIPLI